MKVRLIVAIGVSLGVALAPAAASASITTVYTKSYAGYYDTAYIGPRADVSMQTSLPGLASLAKITNGVSIEIRLYSSQGQLDLQIAANPQTQSVYHTKWEQSGFGTAIQNEINSCNQTYPVTLAPGTLSEDVYVNDPAYNNGDTIVDWSPTVCEIGFNSLVKFTKVAIVGTFNPSTFHASATNVTLASFNSIDIISHGWVSGTVTSYPYGRYIATSTGTATGVKRAVPSPLDSTGSAFTVSIP